MKQTKPITEQTKPVTEQTKPTPAQADLSPEQPESAPNAPKARPTAAQKRRRALRRWLLGIGVVVVLLLLIPCMVLAGYLLRHVDYDDQADPWSSFNGICRPEDFGLTERVHTLTTADGISIRCAEIPVEQPRAVILYLTGIDQPSVSYFYAHAAWMQQYSVASFLPDLRAHGASSGHKIGLGYTEMEDIRAILSLIQADPVYCDLPLVIQGLSMGGATAINAFGTFPEIDACIAGSAYASFQLQLEDMLASAGVPSFLRAVEAPFLSLTLRLLYGWSTVDELAPIRQIQQANGRPILLMACEYDQNVAAVNTTRLQDACPEAQVWVRPTWDHFVVHNSDLLHVQYDREYCAVILNFLQQAGILPPEEGA